MEWDEIAIKTLSWKGSNRSGQLVAGFSALRSMFEPWSVYVGFVVERWYCDRFYSEFLGLTCQYHSTVARRIHISSWG
jgi:hypothetical protein